MSDLEVGSTIGGMIIEGRLGSGAMGVVYRAVDPELERVVAIKVIASERLTEPGFRERFQREARMAARVDHPHVVTVHSAGEQDGHLYLVTKFVEGTDLAALVRDRGRLDPPSAVRLISQVASALDAAHARGLVHRDVKPANVLVGGTPAEPVAYLADFGLTRPMTVTHSQKLTVSGEVWGTPAYMAPGLLDGDPAGVATDVYALGGTLLTALAGQMFRRGAAVGTPGSTLAEVIADRTLAVALDRVVATALTGDPARRYPTAGALGRAAEEAVASASRPAAPPAVPTPAPILSHTPSPPRWVAPPTPPAPSTSDSPENRPRERPSRRTLGVVATVAVVVVGVGTAVLWPSAPGGATGSDGSIATVVLRPVVDDGTSARLTWTGPELDYGVEVTAEGGGPVVVVAGRVSAASVAVEQGTRYCFRITGSNGGAPLLSNVQPLRGATCDSG